jgi:hypothetical protein
MKKLFCTCLIIANMIALLLATGCKESVNIPVVSTASLTNITVTGVTSGGNVTDDGNADIIARGVCWSTLQDPTVKDPHSSDGTGSGSFTSTVTGLNSGTAYYIKAYATNSEGTGYGLEEQFTTLGSAPVATTLDATSVQAFTATLNGSVNANYISTTVTFEYGLTTSYGNTAAATPSPVTGNTTTDVHADLTGLNAGTTYHFRVKTVNSLGTTYGNDKSFTTLGQAPSATTLDATNVQSISATLNGTVNANYLSTTVTFEYGLTTSYGSTITAAQSPATGNTITNVSADISGLLPGNVTYHFRVVVVNSLGTTYGDDMTFVTLGQPPTARTSAATNVTSTGATLNGTVNARNLSTTVTFEYGLTTSYGNTITAVQSPVSGNTNTSVSADISGLTSATTYNYRVKAVNALGITYGNNLVFTTGAK